MSDSKTVFVDTNILFSASASQGRKKGWRAHFFHDRLLPNFEVVISDYIVSELEDALRSNLKRHKDFRRAWKNFKKNIRPRVAVVATPEEMNEQEELIKDIKDWPILRAALISASILLTEDEDFLRERDLIEGIEILNINEFVEKYLPEE